MKDARKEVKLKSPVGTAKRTKEVCGYKRSAVWPGRERMGWLSSPERCYEDPVEAGRLIRRPNR
jgi:hypothetical protein